MGGGPNKGLSTPGAPFVDGTASEERRPMTPAEARFLLASLSYPAGPEVPRRIQSGLSRSTYHAIRTRVERQGWLQECFVPDPAALGFNRMSVLLGSTFAERRTQAVEAVAREPHVTNLWLLPQAVFAVAFHRDEEEAAAFAERNRRPEWYARAHLVQGGVTREEVPIYFDFEGAWSHLIGNGSLVAYPVPVPRSSLHRPPSTRESAILRETVRLTSFRRGLIGLPRRTRRVIEQEWVGVRTFLRPWNLPEFEGRMADQIVFLVGRSRGRPLPEFLSALTGEARVFPFLLVDGGGTILLAMIGQSRPIPSSASGRHRGVMEVLGEYLTEIETLATPSSGVTPQLEHRYASLVAGHDHP